MKHKYILPQKILVCIVAIAGAGQTMAATITVTGNGDTSAVDGAVTLREAIISINNGANLNADVVAVGSYGTNDTIAFNIPGAGVHSIATSGPPLVSKPLTIDGYTQPGASPNTNPPGQGVNTVLQIELTLDTGLLGLGGGSSTVRGLAINGATGGIFLLNTGGNTIAGNFIGTNVQATAPGPHGAFAITGVQIASSSAANVIGGLAAADRNVIAGTSSGITNNVGINIASAGNLVLGNLIGTNAAGSAALANDHGIVLNLGGADNNTIGGTTASARNVISGNRVDGISMNTSGNRIQGNFVGVDAAGSAAIANGNFGIVIGGTNNAIGGTAVGAGNVISGNGTVGVAITSGSTGNTVQGNRIGTDASGMQSVCGHTTAGVEVSGGGNAIGGAQAGAANLIAFNKHDGVRVDGGTGSSILHNSIFSNGGAGIRLGSAGTPNVNDLGDADSGPNNLQNYPLLSATGVGASGFDIGATLNSTVGVFHLEFFASKTCGHFSHGEGQTFIGSADVASDNNGNSNFPPQFFFTPPGQTALTATATDAAGNTSEYSLCLDDRIFADSFEPLPGICQ